MPDLNNRARGMRFRELMAAVFQAADVSVRTRAGQKLSDVLADDDTSRGDLLGLDDWLILCRANVGTAGYGEAMTTSRAIATLEGKRHACVLQYRQGALGSGHFALLEVGDLADLIRELEDAHRANEDLLSQVQVST